MPDEGENKTEPATPRRRQEARESGQVAKSADLTSASLLLVGLLTLWFLSQIIVNSLREAMTDMLGEQYFDDAHDAWVSSIQLGGPQVIKALVPILLILAASAVIIVGLQVGFHITAQPLMPNLARLNPFGGFGRLFAGRNWVHLVMNLLKATIIGAVAWTQFQSQLPTILSLSAVEFPANFGMAADIIFSIAWRLAVALLILAFVDWIYQRWRFERDIRMSKQEIKEDAKRMEGDQAVKGRRRQLARKMILQRIHADVPKADVVVTNPTELAIALRYDADAMSAPRVVAKGAGFLAARIRQVAIQNGVPIVERKPLAQALYKNVDVGQEVPAQFYQAVAEILAYVYELAGKGRRLLKAKS